VKKHVDYIDEKKMFYCKEVKKHVDYIDEKKMLDLCVILFFKLCFLHGIYSEKLGSDELLCPLTVA
jgi:hypothetical protein